MRLITHLHIRVREHFFSQFVPVNFFWLFFCNAITNDNERYKIFFSSDILCHLIDMHVQQPMYSICVSIKIRVWDFRRFRNIGKMENRIGYFLIVVFQKVSLMKEPRDCLT